MDLPFLQRKFTGENQPQVPAARAVAPSLPALDPMAPRTLGQHNPFMVAMNTDTPQFRDSYGVNRPFEKPIFLGYKDNKALYGGSKLFILY